MPSVSGGTPRPSTSRGTGDGRDQPGEFTWIENLIGENGDGSAGITKQMIIGGVSGWVTGFLSMKIGKAAATAIGGGIILLQVANHQGYININWSRVQRDVDKVAGKLAEGAEQQKKTWSDKLEKKLEKIADKAEDLANRVESRSRRWYDKVFGRESRDLHIFLSSFAVGTALGVITGG